MIIPFSKPNSTEQEREWFLSVPTKKQTNKQTNKQVINWSCPNFVIFYKYYLINVSVFLLFMDYFLLFFLTVRTNRALWLKNTYMQKLLKYNYVLSQKAITDWMARIYITDSTTMQRGHWILHIEHIININFVISIWLHF